MVNLGGQLFLIQLHFLINHMKLKKNVEGKSGEKRINNDQQDLMYKI